MQAPVQIVACGTDASQPPATGGAQALRISCGWPKPWKNVTMKTTSLPGHRQGAKWIQGYPVRRGLVRQSSHTRKKHPMQRHVVCQLVYYHVPLSLRLLLLSQKLLLLLLLLLLLHRFSPNFFRNSPHNIIISKRVPGMERELRCFTFDRQLGMWRFLLDGASAGFDSVGM